ncbi:hypothetical protein EDB83DRAFT_2321377 [Lactarius deliciosus]|nr:hypothetical protein EDB83DRAFT_2321377 [Lactarius deliciosus]
MPPLSACPTSPRHRTPHSPSLPPLSLLPWPPPFPTPSAPIPAEQDTRTRTGTPLAPPPPFAREREEGARARERRAPIYPSRPSPPFCAPPCAHLRKGGAGKDRDHAGPDPPFAPPPQFAREWGAAWEGVCPAPLVCAQAHDARRPPAPPFSVHATMSARKGGTRGHAPSFAALPSHIRAPSHKKGAHEGTSPRPLPLWPRAQYARKGGKRCPARPPPLAAAPCTRGKGECEMRLAASPFPIRAEGGCTARGHATPLCPRSLPFLHGHAVLNARKGAHVGAPPSALSFPIRVEGAHEGTLPDDPPWPPPGGAGKVSPPAPVCANGGTTREPPSRRLPPFSRKGGTGAPPTLVHRSDARTDGGVEWKGGAHPFVPTLVQHGGPGRHTNRGAPRDSEVRHPAHFRTGA